MKFCTILPLAVLSILGSISNVTATPIDLNAFFVDPTVVTVAPDGKSATMAENPGLSPVLMVNDPFFGDPGIFIPLDSGALSFSVVFNEPAGNDDSFSAFLFDPATFNLLQDAQGHDLYIELSDPVSTTVSWNLRNAPFLNQTIGMQFQLNSNPSGFDTAFDSTVTISSVGVNPVPEPATFILFGIGLGNLIAAGRKSGQKR